MFVWRAILLLRASSNQPLWNKWAFSLSWAELYTQLYKWLPSSALYTYIKTRDLWWCTHSLRHGRMFLSTSCRCTDSRGWTQVNVAGRCTNGLCQNVAAASAGARIQAAAVKRACARRYQRRQAGDVLSLEVMAQAPLNGWHSFTFLHILLFNLWLLFRGNSPYLHLISSFAPALLHSPARFSGERLCPSSLFVLPLRSHPSCQEWAALFYFSPPSSPHAKLLAFPCEFPFWVVWNMLGTVASG